MCAYFQFFNDEMLNYILLNTFVHLIIQKLKNKHTFLKTEKAKLRELSFLSFEGSGLFFNFWIQQYPEICSP